MCSTILFCAGCASFTVRPTDQEPLEGSSFSATCSAVGALFLFWQKEGGVISRDDQNYMQSSGDVPGTTTLSVSAANHSIHSGNYQCMVVYLDSSIDSVQFSISVKCEPSISNHISHNLANANF